MPSPSIAGLVWQEFEPLLVDCLHILATKWADVPDTLSHAVMGVGICHLTALVRACAL